MRQWRSLGASLALAGALAAGGACTEDRDPGTERRGPAPTVTAGLAWRRLAPAPSERTEVAAAAVGKKIYVAGGFRGDGDTVATVEVFDAAAGSWSVAAGLPVPVNHAMAATARETVYLFGGYLAGGEPSASAYRLANGGWQPVAAMPEGRGAATAVAVGDTVYIVGGIGPGGLAKQMLVYDAAADRWFVADGPPTPREHLGGAAFGGLVYSVGGRTRQDGNLGAFEAYDPSARAWRRLPDLPTARGGLAAAAVCTGHVVAVGGEAKATFPEVEAYDVRAGRWSSLPGLPTPRHGLGVVGIDAMIYTLSGGPEPGLHVAGDTEAIDLAGLGTCPSPPTSSPPTSGPLTSSAPTG